MRLSVRTQIFLLELMACCHKATFFHGDNKPAIEISGRLLQIGERLPMLPCRRRAPSWAGGAWRSDTTNARLRVLVKVPKFSLLVPDSQGARPLSPEFQGPEESRLFSEVRHHKL